MQKLYLGKTNRVFLNTEITVDSVEISLIDAVGAYIKDDGNNDIEGKTCTLDVPSGKYFYDIIFYSSITAGDAYIYWDATSGGNAVVLEGAYSPEDAIIASVISTDALLVSPTFVMDNFLRGITEEEIEATMVGYTFRDIIRDNILAATEQLEEKTLIYFQSTTISREKHDFKDIAPIYEKFWQQPIYHPPIISVTEVRLVLNNQEIVNVPAEWQQVGNYKEGIIKIMPYTEGASGLAFKMITKAGMGLAILLGSAFYVPDFFEYTYESGLDWDNLLSRERNSIKMAIGRRVALNMLPNLDVHRGLSSQSRSIDGASTTQSFTSSAMYGEHSAALEKFEKQEKEWINLIKRKYATRLQVDGF